MIHPIRPRALEEKDIKGVGLFVSNGDDMQDRGWRVLGYNSAAMPDKRPIDVIKGPYEFMLFRNLISVLSG